MTPDDVAQFLAARLRLSPSRVLLIAAGINDYYRGDPEARLAERRQKLQVALVGRQTYWKAQGDKTEAAGG